MKVMFLISARATGLGGHFYSLRSIAEALQNDVSCMIVNIGRVQAKALAGTRVPLREVVAPGRRIAWRLRELCRIIREFNPDVLHAFDTTASFYARSMGMMFKRSVVATKCGGPNPHRYFPLHNDLIVFSQEDETYFKTKSRYRNVRIHLIPNRVNEVPQSADRIRRVRSDFNPQDAVFLRIGRIAPCYLDLSLRALALVRRLRADGVPARFLHIGVINDDATAARLRSELGEEDRLITDSQFTLGASEMIEAGDFLIGTGRGFMESASRGRVLLASVADSPFPALVTADNWQYLFQTNFSPRGVIPDFDAESNYRSIRSTVRQSELRSELGKFSRRMFEQWFYVESAIPSYLSLYASCRPIRESHPVDLAIQASFMFRRG